MAQVVNQTTDQTGAESVRWDLGELFASPADPAIEADLRPFFYLPFEHSESLVDQEFSVELFAALQADTGDEESMKFALIHRDIIARFGRFPHRNPGLGRITTDAEREFLDEGGFAG